MRISRACGFLILSALLATASAASEFATIVADEILYSAADRRFIAAGNVVVTWQGEQFKAKKIAYDGDSLQADGPLEFTDRQETSVIADYGEMSADFRNALMEGVELLLEGRIQINAERLERSDGRLLRLEEAMATACGICREGRTPLWHFRARSIVHDAENNQIYLRNSRFYIKNTPVFYFPWMRIPDPSVTRTSGFLFPTLELSDDVGIGMSIPYYLTLGDHADMTLAPEFTTRKHQGLSVEYRRMFRTGLSELDASIVFNNSDAPRKRWHVGSYSQFSLGGQFKLEAAGERVSDPDYLEDYDISFKPRIENRLGIERRQPGSYFEAAATEFEILGKSLQSPKSPLLVQEARWKKRFNAAGRGWRAALEAGVAKYGNFQASDDGNETVRTFARLTLNRDWVLAGGVRASAAGNLLARTYSFADPLEDDIRDVNPSLSTELRWPWLRKSEGKREIFEPFMSAAWSPRDPARNPNLDSYLVELDDTNFNASSRFPGFDAVERGLRASYGVRYAIHAPGELNSDIFVGRVHQKEPAAAFDQRSGLGAMRSNWAASLDLEAAEGFSFRQKILADSDFSPIRSDMILGYELSKFGISVQRSWEKTGFAESSEGSINHWLAKAEYPLAGNWTGSVEGKYDVAKHSDRRIDFNFNYAHQCLDVKLFLSHRLPSAELSRAKTSLGLSMELAGFGDGSSVSAEACD